jgi:cation diffusion facilitator CzcD-associated flavoprotein CzcO
VYQSTFAPNTQWSEEYAQGAEIRDYWQSVARKYDVYSKLQLRTKVLGAYWEPNRSQWRLETRDLESGQEKTEYYDFVLPAIGHFNEWRLPNIPGIGDFKGHLRHSSNWDPTFDPKGKRIATIGNGASGIQITPELQKVASHVDHYARSRTWIAGSFNPNAKDRQATPMYFTPEQLDSFKDPESYLKYRKEIESPFWRSFDAQLRDSELSKTSAQRFREIMRERLADRPELLDQIVPDFPPHCRRLTPGPGYLEALTKDNLTFIQTPISHFTTDGIVTVDGEHRPVDAVICSTGANVDFAPPFPIVAGDYDLSRDWRPEGKFGFPYSYIGVGVPSFPNLLLLHGTYVVFDKYLKQPLT